MRTPTLSPAKAAFRKAKNQSISHWKKKLWPLVSLYIRRRDADEWGMVACCSCGLMRHWKQGDAGHFIDGKRNSIVYDVRNIHFQCKPCNGSFINQKLDPKDIKTKYEEFMVKRYGKKVVEELREKNKETKQWTIPELQELIKVYVIGNIHENPELLK